MRFSNLKFTLGLGLCLALVAVDANAGCFGGPGLFGRIRARRTAAFAPAYSESFSSFQSTPNGYQYQGYQFRATVPQSQILIPQAPAAPRSAPSCTTGACSVSYSAPTPAGDYITALNQLRARFGRSPVVFDQQMANDANYNNSQQIARGIGHFFMGRARRQNAAMGQSSALAALYAWENSPGHMDALLDPSITRVAIVGNGPAWTFNAY